MVGFQMGGLRVDVAENTVRIMKDGVAVWLTADELRWLFTAAGPGAVTALEEQLRARGQTHLGTGTSPAPEA